MKPVKPSHLSNPWNNAVAYLEMSYGKQMISSGSCFFWAKDGRMFLVTNWHNLAGRNPLSGKPISPTGAIPDRIAFLACKQTSEPDADGYFDIRSFPVEAKLCESDLTKPLWFEHPKFGERVDVAAVEVTDLARGFLIKAANELESDAQLDVVASQDVFVVGFPFGLIANAPAPIWKRGSIALDPSYDPESLPKMLVDTATREGMSGSVVIARHIIVARAYTKKDGSTSEPMMYATRDLVTGIYSGRHYPDLEKAQVGVVWKRSTIEETVSAMKIANV